MDSSRQSGITKDSQYKNNLIELSSSCNLGGAGLELAIARELSQAHGGEISVASCRIQQITMVTVLG